MIFLLYFLLWTLFLYIVHRAVHVIPVMRAVHLDHHAYVNNHTTGWHWNNIFLYNDTIKSTVDLWITEIIPTLLFAIAFGQYWLIVFYYIWAAFFQEAIEHNINIDLPVLTSGRWHMIHHRSPYNYGLFIPVWDMIFGTYKKVT